MLLHSAHYERDVFGCSICISEEHLRCNAKRRSQFKCQPRTCTNQLSISNTSPMHDGIADLTEFIHIFLDYMRHGPRKAESIKHRLESLYSVSLIEQCGYHRRDEELADAEEAAKNR